MHRSSHAMSQRAFLGAGWARGGSSEVVRRAHPASGAQWNVQVVRGKVNGKCLWNACKALSLGLLLMVLGAAMATIGYYADHLSIAQEVRGNHTVKVKNESRGFHLNNLSYAGPIVMGVGEWAQYSMLKSCMIVYNNIDISKYAKLMAFLKCDGYKAKKSKILTTDQIAFFLSQANDDEYLMIKIALIFGISGACRGDELTNLRVDDIEDVVSSLIITIPNTKTKISRTFVVTRTEGNTNLLDLYRKYAAPRPPHTSHGKCTTQPVGKNTFGKIPSIIATYLGLSDPTLYTGHCLRRSSATLLADAVADITTVAEGYIDNSVQNKTNIANQVLQAATTSSPLTVLSQDPNSKGFIVVAACVMTFEARDSAAKVVPARFKLSTMGPPSTSVCSHGAYSRHGSLRTSAAVQTGTVGVVQHNHTHCHSSTADRRTLTQSFMHFSRGLAIETQHSKNSLKVPQGSINRSPSAPDLILERQASTEQSSPNVNHSMVTKPNSKPMTFAACALLNPGLLHRHALSVDETAASYRLSNESLHPSGSQGSMAMDLHLDYPVTLRVRDRRRNPLKRQRRVDEEAANQTNDDLSRRSSHSCSPRIPSQSLKDTNKDPPSCSDW
ncbi:hypothetical protein NQ317_014185 [Molorchus minor]|uniref:Tyr recombinase domain-containing protein n=1 Tax=Molorchus minor TaxID=1323400 RepID=A0ABQ9JIX7_9CUCU|nr:hypothetical protein NQ317_014185 [Molorchus minor]